MALWACSAPTDEMLAYVMQPDRSHLVEPVPLGVVEDPVRMVTELGSARRGGYVTLENLENAHFRAGGPVHVRHVVQNGVFVPQDEEGLVLGSFFHHLGEARDRFEALGFGAAMSDLFPVDAVAFNPTLASDLLSFENAGYAETVDFHGFVLFPDGNREVPLGAHAGVVRHELAHGFVAKQVPLFRIENLLEAYRIVGQTPLRAVNEGFADMVAVLTTDDAGVIPIEGRDAAELRTYEDIDENDPYSTGVVLASFAWRLREEVGDPEETLLLMIEALEQWDREGRENGLTTPERFADWMAAAVLVEHPEATKVVCSELALRFDREILACKR